MHYIFVRAVHQAGESSAAVVFSAKLLRATLPQCPLQLRCIRVTEYGTDIQGCFNAAFLFADFEHALRDCSRGPLKGSLS